MAIGMTDPDAVGYRYVRLRCPVCNFKSPVCDQRTDIRRSILSEWWEKHVLAHRPNPIIEACEGED